MPETQTISMDDDGLPAPTAVLAALFAWVGLLCTLGANFWCGFATQGVTATLQSDSSQTTTTQVTSGIWNYESYEVFTSTNGEATTVTTYAYCVPYSNVVFDAKWKSAMAFSILAAVIGGITSITSCWVFCVKPSKVMASILAMCVLLTTFFQGLTFLYFPSNGCTSGPPTYGNPNGDTYDLSWSKCVLSHGANLSISSVVLWFVAAVLMLCFAASFNGSKGDAEAMTAKSAETKQTEAAADTAKDPEPETEAAEPAKEP